MINANNIKYEIIEQLYDNKNSQLFLCKNSGKYYVAKCYREKYKNRWQKEVNVFSDINNYSNIIQYEGSWSDVEIFNNRYHIILTEHAKFGDLFDHLITNYYDFTLQDLKKIFLQILGGLKELNRNGWAHRD